MVDYQEEIYVKNKEELEKLDLNQQNLKLYYNSKSEPLANFYLSPIKVGEKTFKWGEQYFQYLKHIQQNPTLAEKIYNADTVDRAHQLGQCGTLLEDWDKGKNLRDEAMFEVMLAKFSQNEDLKKILLETKDKILVQIDQNNYYGMAVPFDSEGQIATGKNVSGKTLMKVRDILAKQQ